MEMYNVTDYLHNHKISFLLTVQVTFEGVTCSAQFPYNFMTVSALSGLHAQFTVWWFLAHYPQNTKNQDRH